METNPAQAATDGIVVFWLQGKIRILVFGKVQSFRLYGNPLDGIIFEAAALGIQGFQALFGTQDVSVFQFCAKLTVCTGTVDFFAKQHRYLSIYGYYLHYTPTNRGIPL